MAALNGSEVPRYTLDQFWLSAIDPQHVRPRLIGCNEASRSVGAILEELRASARVPGTASDQDIIRKLPWPTICLLPAGYPSGVEDDELITSLSGRFPQILFVAWPGDAAESLARIATFKTVVPIAPPVELIAERAHALAWEQFELKAGWKG
jgi:hypothetical protein